MKFKKKGTLISPQDIVLQGDGQRTILAISAQIHSLNHLQEMNLEIKTDSENKYVHMSELFSETKEGFHYFILPVRNFEDVESLKFWKIVSTDMKVSETMLFKVA